MLRDRFLREVPQAWQEYRSSVARLQGAGTLSQIDLLTGQTLERSSGEFRQRGDLSRRILQNLGPEMHDGHAYVRNANYAFELLRRDANSPWVIVGLIPDVREGFRDDDVTKMKYAHVLDDCACLALQVERELLFDMVKAPGFSLGSVTPANRDGIDLVRVDFDFEPPETRNHPVRGGWVLLDSAKYWTIVEFEVKGAWGDGEGTITGNYQYVVTGGGLPVVRRVTRRQRAESEVDGPVDHEYLGEGEWFENADVPDSEFTLTAFGLPEPVAAKRRWSFLIVLNVLGALLIAIGFLLHRAAQRRAKSA